MKKSNLKSASMKHIINDDFEFFHYRDETSRNFEYKNHDKYEIFFLISGRVTYLVEGRSYKLSPGDILLINNNELHKPIIEPGETYERIIIWIKPDFLSKHSIESCNLSYCFEQALEKKQNLIRLKPENLKSMRNAIYSLEEACESTEFGNHILKNSFLMEIVVYINRHLLKAPGSSLYADVEYNEKINKIVNYINENLSEDLSLDRLASKFYMNKYYLLHEFKKYTGYSIHQFILQKRLIMARNLAKEGKPVHEICEECGFGDYSNFIRAFKNTYGMPPKKYFRSQLHL